MNNSNFTKRLPALFIGHGNPMNAITDNPYRDAWLDLGKNLPRPSAILCISAHWQTRGTQVCIANSPKTVHDFGGFPAKLFSQQYTAPGAPEFANMLCDLFATESVTKTENWGLDHGAWTILQSIFPAADVPVFQLSLDVNLDFAGNFAFAKHLASLRELGMMMIAICNITSNLGKLNPYGPVTDWALSFNNYIKEALKNGNDAALINLSFAGKSAKLAVPTGR